MSDHTDNDFDLEQFLPYRLAVAAANVSEAFAKKYRASHNLSRAEWRIICHLSRSGSGLSIRDLEKCIHLEKSKTSRAVSKMEKRGFVDKKPHKTDARLVEIFLTSKGRQVFQELVPEAKYFQEQLGKHAPIADMDAFLKALEEIAKLDILQSRK